MLTRVLVAAVVGGIAFFILGFLIYGLFLDPMVMKPNMVEYAGLMKDPPGWVALVLGNVVSALLLAYIFEKWAGVRTFMGGVTAGATIWFLMSLAFQLMFIAFWNLSKNYIPPITDLCGATVMGAIGGGVIGQVLGMMNKGPASE